MAGRSILRRSYDALALFALLNMAVLAGLTGFAWFSGIVNKNKLTQVAAILRGENLVSAAPSAATVEAVKAPSTAEVESTGNAPSPADVELLRREAERLETELEQQTALVQSMMIKITTERESLRKERESLKKPESPNLQQRREEGMRKQIEIYEQLTPKVALEHMLGLEDVDQAARVLAEMEPRKAKRIIESAKTTEQSARIQAILQRIQDVAPMRSAELAAAGS